MANRPPRRVIKHDDENMTVVRFHGRGLKDPGGVSIEMHREVGDGVRNGWINRKIKITIDELFDLTEMLDDLCDEIEDKITDHKGH